MKFSSIHGSSSPILRYEESARCTQKRKKERSKYRLESVSVRYGYTRNKLLSAAVNAVLRERTKGSSWHRHRVEDQAPSTALQESVLGKELAADLTVQQSLCPQ
jgi:hypothetical protein